MAFGSKQKRKHPEILPELEACPFLGLEEDAATWVAYPHSANSCHRAKPICNISLGYQESACLTKEHIHCPGFVSGWNGSLPQELHGEAASARTNRSLVWPVLIPALVLVLFASWLAARQGWLPFLGSQKNATPTSLALSPSQVKATELSQATATPMATTTPVPSSTPDALATQTALAALASPTPTLSPTTLFSATPPAPTLGPALGTPFGPDGKYLLHQLAAGESMGTLVSLYNTSNKVIEASNVLIPGASIWPGTVLVILPGVKNPEAAIRFRVVLLEAPTTVNALAAEYNVSEEDLRLYNSLGSEQSIPAGRYIIIPVD